MAAHLSVCSDGTPNDKIFYNHKFFTIDKLRFTSAITVLTLKIPLAPPVQLRIVGYVYAERDTGFSLETGDPTQAPQFGALDIECARRPSPENVRRKGRLFVRLISQPFHTDAD